MSGKNQSVCCTSPAAACYWFAASLIAWAVLSIVGKYLHPLRWYSASTILLAMSIGCVANWLKNRSFHCSITAWLFLLGGVLFLLTDLRILRVNVALLWSCLFIGAAIAFLLEWRLARRCTQR
jgi:hypothetical protein